MGTFIVHHWRALLITYSLLVGGISLCRAQSDTLLQQANRQYSLKAYGRAIELYTQLLADSSAKLNAEQHMKTQAQLAHSYKLVGDVKKAEQTYQTLTAAAELPGSQAESYRQYAQLLAETGKYEESQRMYEKYDQLKKRAVKAESAPFLTSATRVIGKSAPTRYRLEVLGLNTSNAEFSPMYYRDGLVFVSGKKASAAIETAGKGGGGSYLDLFYIQDRQQLKTSQIIKADGTVSKPVQKRGRKDRQMVGAARSRATANDSRTLGGYNDGIVISEGLRYSKTVQPFSRSINSRYHEGPVTFFQDGYRMIFTRNNYDGRRVRQSAEGVTNLKLYTATQQNGTWVNIEELPFNSDDYSVGHPALSSDDRLLFFASDMPGGLGGTDLYVSRNENGKWTKPVNLGKEINTKGNDLFPFIDERGNLYFASDGRKGLGGLDVYYVPLADGVPAGPVEHLEAPINSEMDDFGLITDGNRKGGYFSTNRRKGDDDIFRFVRESALYGCRNLTLRFYDELTQQPIDSVHITIKARAEGRKDQTVVTKKDGLVQLCLESNNDFVFRASRDGYVTSTVGFSTRALTDDSPSQLEIALNQPPKVIDTVQYVSGPPDDGWDAVDLQKSRVQGVVMSEKDHRPITGVTVVLKNDCNGATRQVLTGPDGRYEFELVEGCSYTLSASKAQYGTNTGRIQKIAPRSAPKIVSADLSMLRVGDILPLKNIDYDLDQWTIRPEAYRELDKWVATLQKYSTLTVEVRSHTDSRGDAARNRYLSAQRASSVVNYLASKGISRKRMIAAGYGESVLLNNCDDDADCTDAEHQRNRRTEFKVLSVK
ncbi:outer membrane protein OmpA-like peptidoglycan-associated protein [Larkinella arboricola]|uniref:Outer membrane protein OmpA-like peptidoglycan-associated protein n=1 Tax=Larkinella arboricola TaxID=643671 RepID=A0A327X770_LARAB|nr:carboxypeptidase regulatory-like domain-containing protein [Larkinella arboricola]RAK02058.1 outer membrane protein OmpA-like peptidoglycan-associated protein [Larkinella arboricola]